MLDSKLDKAIGVIIIHKTALAFFNKPRCQFKSRLVVYEALAEAALKAEERASACFGRKLSFSPAPAESKNRWSPEKTEVMIEKYFKEDADEAKKLQKAAYPGKPLQNVLFTDAMFRPCSFEYLRLRAKECKNNTFGYMFCLEMPPYEGILPWHNAEIPYVFGNAHCIEPSYIPEVTEKLEGIMCHAWCSFAKTGNPGWEEFDNERSLMMYCDKECEVRNSAPEEALVNFLKEHPVSLTRVIREEKPVL